MSAGKSHGERRRVALEEIERFQYKLLTVGAYYASALENSGEQLSDLVDDALTLSPAEVFQSGIMFWVGAAREQVRLFQNVWNTVATPSPPPPPRSRVIDGRITFFLDRYSETSAPVLTDIPQSETVTPSDLTYGRYSIPSKHVTLSSPSNGKPTYVVSLSDLNKLLMDRPPGRYAGKLTWQDGKRSQIVEAYLDRPAE
ncbi:MAG TPA: hypothetical protein VMU50_17955 [Polyangia bacterium]|nr:hypothetical protein [Polyangia bacterium]